MRLTRRERIKLLLRTLNDATGPGCNLTSIHSALDSRPPSASEIWYEGSYHQLINALNQMRPYPKIRRHTVAYYVDRETWGRKSEAQKGLIILDKLMPKDIFVPAEISENAGFTPGEAKVAARVRLHVA